MLKPFYFPFTCMSDRERESIGAFFNQVSVFRAFEPENPDPFIQVLVPVTGGEENVRAFLKEYKAFAAYNMEKASAFLKSSSHKPLFDPTWASELRSEIVRFMGDHDNQDEADPEQQAQSLLWARAFMEIAHEYDENNLALDAELETFENREKQLFDSLMGGDVDDKNELAPLNQTVQSDGSYLHIRHRLAAWATLFVSAWPDRGTAGDWFFLTTQSAVIEELEEFVPGFRHLCDISAGDMNKDDIEEQVKRLLTRPSGTENQSFGENGAKRKNDVLSLYVAEEISPFACFNGILNRGLLDGYDRHVEIKNTVVGLIRS